MIVFLSRSEIQKEAKFWQKSEHLWRFTSKSLFPGGQPLEGEDIQWIILFEI
jgi:hypothetical protein